MMLSRLSQPQLKQCRKILQNLRQSASNNVTIFGCKTPEQCSPKTIHTDATTTHINTTSTDMKNHSPKSIWTTAKRHMNSGNNNSGNGGKNAKDDDPFGISYQDNDTKLGPESELPPHYIRDPISGKITGEKKVELTSEEKKLLDMSEEELETVKLERLMETWEKSTSSNTEDGGYDKELDVARLIRREKMKLNTFGRSTSSIPKSSRSGANNDPDYDELLSETEPDPSAPLSPNEFASFQAYLKKYQKISITKEDIPTVDTPVSPGTEKGFDPDQDLSWIRGSSTHASKGGGAGSEEENAWMEDILPSDLAPPRKLNRKEAKPIPKALLHQNNLALLRRYVTPGGQIVNRVQSRLGAKDQRKVAKLIKRGRALGLIPYFGQWKYEDHGDLFADDIEEDREWEKELKERGLEIEHKLEDYQD